MLMSSVHVDLDWILRSSWFTKYVCIYLFILLLELEKIMLYRASIYTHREPIVQHVTFSIRGVASSHSACK